MFCPTFILYYCFYGLKRQLIFEMIFEKDWIDKFLKSLATFDQILRSILDDGGDGLFCKFLGGCVISFKRLCNKLIFWINASKYVREIWLHIFCLLILIWHDLLYLEKLLLNFEKLLNIIQYNCLKNRWSWLLS